MQISRLDKLIADLRTQLARLETTREVLVSLNGHDKQRALDKHATKIAKATRGDDVDASALAVPAPLQPWHVNAPATVYDTDRKRSIAHAVLDHLGPTKEAEVLAMLRALGHSGNVQTLIRMRQTKLAARDRAGRWRLLPRGVERLAEVRKLTGL